MTILDAETIRKNFAAYLRFHGKALDVLRKAKGKCTYVEISKEVGLPKTTTSSLLNNAQKLGLATKEENGCYKKIPGIMAYKQNVSTNEEPPKSPTKSLMKKASISVDPLEREAWRNAESYPLMYILENKIRQLILSRLGTDWWKTPTVPQKIIDYAQRIKEDEKETPWMENRGDHPVYYITLKHLCTIIQMNGSNFKKIEKMNVFLTRFEDLYPLRNSLAHNRSLTPRDKSEIELSVGKISKLLKVKYNI